VNLKESNKNQGIQALRGIAVISVVLFHAFPKQFSSGYLGVDVFFVISGYLVIPRIYRITNFSKLRSQLIEFKSYAKSRTNRLIPPLAGVLILYSIPMLILGNLDDLTSIFKQMWASLFGVGNVGAYLFSGNYFSDKPNPFLHMWSLAVEMQLYFLVPILFILLKLIFKHRMRVILLLSITGAISYTVALWPQLLVPIYSKVGIADHEIFSYFDLTPRVWEFLLGGIAALSPKLISAGNLLMARIPSQCLFFTLLLALSFFSRLEISSVIEITLINLLTAITLVKLQDKPVCPRSLRTFQRVGDISYTLYLVHMPNLYLFRATFESLDFPSWAGLSIGILTMFPISLLLYKIFEKQPYSGGGNSGLKRIQFRTSTLFLCAAVMLTSVTISVFKTDLIASKIEPSADYAGWVDPKCQRDSFDGPPCKYLTQNAREILLIGDSRAGMLSSTIIDVARGLEVSATIWTHSGCRLNLTLGKEQPKNCKKNSLDALSYIEEKRPSHVIVSQALSHDEPVEELINSIKQVQALGVQVTVITPIPILSDPNFNRRGSLLIPKDQPLYSISEKALDPDSMGLRAEYIRALLRGRVNMIDPFDVLCKETICILKSGNSQYYRDNNHLSPSGASLLEQKISSSINSF